MKCVNCLICEKKLENKEVLFCCVFMNQGKVCDQTDSSSGNGIFANISIAPFYPQGHDYVFICNATGFTPTSYSWYYGDGQTLVNSTLNNVFHTYNVSGQFTAACRAESTTDWAVSTMKINVN